MDFKNFRMRAVALYCDLQSPCRLDKLRLVSFRWIIIYNRRETPMKCIPNTWINAPINSKLQHPPRAYPGHLTVHRVRGGGNLNVALEGWGI